jgi:hypothetical protein
MLLDALLCGWLLPGCRGVKAHLGTKFSDAGLVIVVAGIVADIIPVMAVVDTVRCKVYGAL